MSRGAAIDIGTNSVRLLVADVAETARSLPRLRPVLRRLTITRLGEGLASRGRLLSAPVTRTVNAVREFIALSRAAGVPAPALVGTYALRTACNPEALLARLDHPLRILSGTEEARLGYQGVLAGLRPARRPRRLLVVDIGGGSVELTCGSGGRVEATRSVPAGAVVLTERFLAHDPPRSEEIAALRRYLARVLGHIPTAPARPFRIVGVGGTITTMAAIAQRLAPYDPDLVHGFRLSHRQVRRLAAELAAMPAADRRRLPGLQPERADIIGAGALVLDHLLAAARAVWITVSEADLLWALVLQQSAAQSLPRVDGERE